MLKINFRTRKDTIYNQGRDSLTVRRRYLYPKPCNNERFSSGIRSGNTVLIMEEERDSCATCQDDIDSVP